MFFMLLLYLHSSYVRRLVCLAALLAAISDCVYEAAGRPAGWHFLIRSGLGTNAEKRSVDGTGSQPFPLG